MVACFNYANYSTRFKWNWDRQVSDHSEKAKLQWKLEAEFRSFEGQY